MSVYLPVSSCQKENNRMCPIEPVDARGPRSSGLEFLLEPQPAGDEENPSGPFVAGAICPYCGLAVLDYDGLLNLVCPACGKMETGGCT